MNVLFSVYLQNSNLQVAQQTTISWKYIIKLQLTTFDQLKSCQWYWVHWNAFVIRTRRLSYCSIFLLRLTQFKSSLVFVFELGLQSTNGICTILGGSSFSLKFLVYKYELRHGLTPPENIWHFITMWKLLIRLKATQQAGTGEFRRSLGDWTSANLWIHLV